MPKQGAIWICSLHSHEAQKICSLIDIIHTACSLIHEAMGLLLYMYKFYLCYIFKNFPIHVVVMAEFGKTILKRDFYLADNHAHINHGSYGAVPKPVHEERLR